jgi:hypothetical protein
MNHIFRIFCIFQLITCTKIGEQDVIFVDGTRKCPWGLISVAVVLSVVPVVFWALLKFNKIPAPAKAAVCSAYTDSRYYWVTVTLIARFLMTVVFATVRDFPSLTAFGLLIFSMAMFTQSPTRAGQIQPAGRFRPRFR